MRLGLLRVRQLFGLASPKLRSGQGNAGRPGTTGGWYNAGGGGGKGGAATDPSVGGAATSAWSTATSDFYNTQGQWFQTLGTKIQKVSNKIHQKTLRGGANFLVVSPTVATILESIPGYAADTNGDKMDFAMGVQKVGQLNSRFRVYKNPYMTENVADNVNVCAAGHVLAVKNLERADCPAVSERISVNIKQLRRRER